MKMARRKLVSGNTRQTASAPDAPEGRGNSNPVRRRAAAPLALFALGFLASSALAGGQELRKSPHLKAEIELKGKSITINYGSPRIRGRKIMGELVPYGEVWRTGADEATSLKTAVDLDIDGTKVPAGSYTIYTLPSEGNWKLIVNKQTGQWGTEYNESQDFARIDLVKEGLPSPLEPFTIEFQKVTPDSAILVLEWETTKLTVPVRAR
jgi:hypothetical protein